MKHFLSHRFDERAGTLWDGAREVAITRKAGALLRCLVARAGTTVPHETILAEVWPDAHVQPDNIKVLIRELRLALNDDPRNPRFIRSLPGRGYAFVAPVCEAAALPLDDDNADIVAVHVNRGRELTLLADALAAAARSDACIVTIEAERGMGKTALCDAFLRYAAGLPSVRVCYGQCLQKIGDAEPYFAVLDALNHLTRQWPGLIDDRLRAHAPSWLGGLRPWLSDRATSGTSVIEPTRMLREVGSLMEALGSDGVTVIALDDLQWGDVDTIELLQAIARRRGPMRTLIVATWTPAAGTTAANAMRTFVSDLWPRARLSRIVLSALREEDVRAWLVSRFGEGVAVLAHTLHRLTGGNPLSLTSVLDALVASEIIWEDEGTWQVRSMRFARTDTLPEPVLDALFWRFAQLGSESRRLLDTAAMLGTTFTAVEVAAVAGADEVSPVEHTLDTLRARGFIESVPPSAHSEPLRYGFTHPFHAELLVARHMDQDVLARLRLPETP